MEETTLRSSTKGPFFWRFLLTTIAVIVAVRFLDRPISLFIQDHNKIWGHLTGDLPDTLLIMVVVISITCYGIYRMRKRKQVRDATTLLLHHIAFALPASFLVKSGAKWLFGRVQTRYWLQNPTQYEFHWFHGGDNFMGFPSGHMAVFATLFAAIWRWYPQHKVALMLLLIVLAILLVATNYHFFSDILAGTWLGLLVEALMARLLTQESPQAH